MTRRRARLWNRFPTSRSAPARVGARLDDGGGQRGVAAVDPDDVSARDRPPGSRVSSAGAATVSELGTAARDSPDRSSRFDAGVDRSADRLLRRFAIMVAAALGSHSYARRDTTRVPRYRPARLYSAVAGHGAPAIDCDPKDIRTSSWLPATTVWLSSVRAAPMSRLHGRLGLTSTAADCWPAGPVDGRAPATRRCRP